jgi:integrase
MNKHLKEIGRRAKINESFLKIRTKGRKRVEQTLSKYELITTHTARRSFATNMFKRGIPSRVIMNITGHRTERAFSTYIKVSQDENAEMMLRYLEQSA